MLPVLKIFLTYYEALGIGLGTLVIATFIFSPSKSVDEKKLLFKTEEIAIYSLKKSSLRPKNLIPKKLEHPFEISKEDLRSLLSKIQFDRESSVGHKTFYVFDEEELEYFSKDVVKAAKVIQEDQVLLVISKFLHIKSVLGKYQRNSFLLWKENGELNFIFNEIQYDLSREESQLYNEWSKIPDVDLKTTSEMDFLMENPIYTFQEIDGFSNRRWIKIPVSDPSVFRPEKRKNEYLYEPAPEPEPIDNTKKGGRVIRE